MKECLLLWSYALSRSLSSSPASWPSKRGDNCRRSPPNSNIVTPLINCRKPKPRVNTSIEVSRESMLTNNPNASTELSRRLRSRNASTMSDESVVLQQSYFSPQVVSAVIENEDQPRDSLLSNNEVPPSYEEAQHLPNPSTKV